MNTTSTEQVIKQTIAALRFSKYVELQMAANEHPDRTATL